MIVDLFDIVSLGVTAAAGAEKNLEFNSSSASVSDPSNIENSIKTAG
jgi:hypothetical protein